MIEGNCSHLRRTSGVLQCDLSRSLDEKSIYTVRLTVSICDKCGEVQMHCESPELVTSWLRAGNKRLG